MTTVLRLDELVEQTWEARAQRIADGSWCEDRPFHQQDAGRYRRGGPYGPKRFTWGRVVKVHRIGPYSIVEHLRNELGVFDPDRLKEHPVTEERLFSIFVDGCNANHSYRSLDLALLACVAWRADHERGGYNRAANSRAATYMARLIELEEES
jgi:hypothetical protein